MVRSSIRGLAFSVLALFVASASPAKGDRPARAEGAAWCGTGVQRERDALARGKYHDSLMRRRGGERGKVRLFSEPARTFAASDQGDVAVLVDDGTMVTPANFFDLAGRSLRFEPSASQTYTVTGGVAVYDSTGGTAISLQDDDSKQINLGFSFSFYGTAYSSVQVNSDGNLTFTEPDTSQSARDLGRFSAGPPRIGPFFADLDPSLGIVSYREEPDGISFVWNNVPSFETVKYNSFSVKLFRDGTIEFIYDVKAGTMDLIAGISPGGGIGGITAMDFSSDLPASGLSGTIAEIFSPEPVISETAIAREFLQSHPDEFDQLIVFTTLPLDIPGAFAYEINVNNDVEGLGLSLSDAGAFYGSGGALKSFVMMGSLSQFPQDPNQKAVRTYTSLSVLAHEVAHRWLAFPYLQEGAAGTNALLHATDQAHWSFFFNSDASVMEGTRIDDRGEASGDQRFAVVDATRKYSALDLYLMGFEQAASVPEMFYVGNPTGTDRTSDSLPQLGYVETFGGIRRNFTLSQITAANGLRVPTANQSPKIVRQAFVLLSNSRYPATPEKISQVQTLRNSWVPYFNQMTGGRGYAVTQLQSGPGTTPSNIYFPFFQGGAGRYTGFALVNRGTAPADVLFEVYENDGSPAAGPAGLINPRMITVAAGAQVAMQGQEIHGYPPESVQNGWIEARSSSSEVSGFFLDGDLSGSLLDGAVAGGATASSLYFTRIAAPPYDTLIVVANPGAGQARLNFGLMSAMGMELATAERILNPHGRMAEEISALFSGSALSGAAYIALKSDAGVVGYEEIGKDGAVLALPAQPASTAAALYSAQFASGPAGPIRYFTSLNLINASSQTRTIGIRLIGNNGLPAEPAANPAPIMLAPGACYQARGETVFGLPDAAFTGAIVDGSIEVTADGPGVIGDVVFGDPIEEKFLAGLPLDGNPAAEMLLSQVAQGRGNQPIPYFTGIACYNPNPAGVEITIDVFSRGGARAGRGIRTLGPGQRISKTLPELVPAVTEQVGGYVRITASASIVAFELFGDQALSFLAAVPPQKW